MERKRADEHKMVSLDVSSLAVRDVEEVTKEIPKFYKLSSEGGQDEEGEEEKIEDVVPWRVQVDLELDELHNDNSQEVFDDSLAFEHAAREIIAYSRAALDVIFDNRH